MPASVRNGRLARSIAIVAWLAPSSARAQPSAVGPPSDAGVERAAQEIVPPRLIVDPGVKYPSRALAEHCYEAVDVVLTLELDETGSLQRATVENPQGHGFDEAALAAAEQLRFQPARRGGTPSAARIRYRYRFEPPSAALGDETHVSFRLQPTAARDTSSAPAIQVTVRGERLAPSVASFTRAELRQIPGAFGDPFRAIESLPGVTPVASGLPYFYLRGAPPGNVGYVLDGVRVPYLYHVGAGPSVVQPAIVERVDLYPGGYPARFGRFAGGLVSASTTPPRSELHGEATLRLFDIGGLVESGFAAGRGSLLLGGRYSYTGALLSLAAPAIKLDYRDYQLRASYDLTVHDRVSLFSFGSYDLFGQRQDNVLDILFGSEFYRADLRYDHSWDSGTLRTAVTLGYERTNAALVAGSGDQRNFADRSIGARIELRNALGTHALLQAGADITLDAYRLDGAGYLDPDSPQAQRVARQFEPSAHAASGVWLDLRLQVSPALEVSPGVRVDVYRANSTTALGIDPRLAGRLDVAPALRVLAALGIVHQPPSFILGLPGITPSLEHGLQRSFQNSLGIEIDLDDLGTTTGVTGFYNAFFNMTDAIGTSSGHGNPDYGARSSGASFGAELFLRRRLTKRLGGFLSYTLSRSVRNLEGEFLSAFDRTHVGNAALSYDLGAGFRAGARFVFYSGTPIQASVGSTIVPTTSRVKRESAFYRLDLRLEKRWALGGAAFVSFVAEFMNATLRKELWPGRQQIGPVSIPSLGVEAGF